MGGPHRLARPRTPAFHVGNRGSNPLGDAKLFQGLANRLIPEMHVCKPDPHQITKLSILNRLILFQVSS